MQSVEWFWAVVSGGSWLRHNSDLVRFHKLKYIFGISKMDVAVWVGDEFEC